MHKDVVVSEELSEAVVASTVAIIDILREYSKKAESDEIYFEHKGIKVIL